MAQIRKLEISIFGDEDTYTAVARWVAEQRVSDMMNAPVEIVEKLLDATKVAQDELNKAGAIIYEWTAKEVGAARTVGNYCPRCGKLLDIDADCGGDSFEMYASYFAQCVDEECGFKTCWTEYLANERA